MPEKRPRYLAVEWNRRDKHNRNAATWCEHRHAILPGHHVRKDRPEKHDWPLQPPACHIPKHRPYSSCERQRGPKPELLIGALATSRDPARQYTRLHCSAIKHAVTLVAGKFCDALPVRRDKKRTFPSFKACGGNVTLVVISSAPAQYPRIARIAAPNCLTVAGGNPTPRAPLFPVASTPTVRPFEISFNVESRFPTIRG